jgi:hypothetical protein
LKISRIENTFYSIELINNEWNDQVSWISSLTIRTHSDGVYGLRRSLHSRTGSLTMQRMMKSSYCM